jgi:predicted dehydrogenase
MIQGAIIGTGKIALTGHMPAYRDQKLREKIEIVAAVDISDERRRSFSEFFPNIKMYRSIDESIMNDNIDFIDICAPPKYRRSLIEKAVNKGVNILCEKPFALSMSDAQFQLELLKRNSIVFMPCHQYKYSPIWTNFKKTADKYESKSPLLLQFNVYRLEADMGFTPSLPNWRTNGSYSGGGILADTGIHYIYLSLWMLGEPKRVTAKIYKMKHKDYSVEDTAIVLLEFDKGIAEINLTWAADRRANSSRLIAPDESLHYDGRVLMKYKKGNKKNISVPDAADKSTYISYYVSLIDDFRKKIRSNGSSAEWKHEAFQSIQVLKTCYKSAELNRTVELPLKN